MGENLESQQQSDENGEWNRHLHSKICCALYPSLEIVPALCTLFIGFFF